MWDLISIRGTLTRYYARNRKTAVQQWGEANGVQVNLVRPEEQNVELAPPEEILAGVTSWRDGLLDALSPYLSEKSLWNEDVDATPYYTGKPDWDAFHALLLYAACKAIGKPVPKTVARTLTLPGSRAIRLSCGRRWYNHEKIAV